MIVLLASSMSNLKSSYKLNDFGRSKNKLFAITYFPISKPNIHGFLQII